MNSERSKGWQVIEWAIVKDYRINLQSREKYCVLCDLPVVVIFRLLLNIPNKENIYILLQ